MPILSLIEIKEDLKRGLTRTPKDKNYNPVKGSIQEKYNLSANQITTVFKHPELKGLRTRVESEEITFVEELPQAETSVDTSQEDTQQESQEIEFVGVQAQGALSVSQDPFLTEN